VLICPYDFWRNWYLRSLYVNLVVHHSCSSIITSTVMIIVVTIFIAIFQHYRMIRIVSLSRYFLCVQNDISARHLRYARTIDSPPVYSNFSTLQSHAANDVTRDACDCRPATVAEQRLRPWKTPQLPLKYRVTGGLRGPSRLYDVTTHNYQPLYTLWLSS